MTVTVRELASEEEWDDQFALVGATFGARVTAPEGATRDAIRDMADPRFALVAVDGDETIGGCAAHWMDLSLPGGASVPTTGLSGVGVRAGRGGRGAMRALLEEHLRRSVDAGAAASLLMASEAPLYGRFGYGVTVSVAAHRIDVDRAALAAPLDDEGHVDVYETADSARAAVIDLYEALRASNPGMTARNDGWWRVVLDERAHWKGPADPFVAIHRDADGRPDAYALYVFTNPGSELWRPMATLDVHEFVADSVEAEKALWQFLTRVPLTRELRWRMAPVEPRLRNLLADRRQLDTEMVSDMVWLRPLDIEALLSARTYERDGVAVFAIDDEAFPDQRGPWRLTVEGGRGRVERVDTADLTLAPEHVGMVVLGDSTVRGLASDGLVTATDGGAADSPSIAALSDLLATSVRPRSVSKF